MMMRTFTFAAAMLGMLVIASAVRANSIPANDIAANPPYADGWQSGDNGGTGFQPWSLNGPSDPSEGGFFIGDSTSNGGTGTGNPGSSGGINTSGKAFGLYANSSQIADAERPFDAPLDIGWSFKVDIDNGFINNPGAVGIGLRAGTITRFEFFFNGGDSDYTVNDGTGTHDSGIGYTDGGLSLDFTVTGANSYALDVTPAGGGSTSHFTGSLIGSPSAADIDTFRAFNYNSSNNTAGNFFVNNLVVVPNPAPLRASAALLAVLAMGAFWKRGRVRSALN